MITNWISATRQILNIYELYGYDDEDLPDISYPICYHDIAEAQKTDSKLQQKLVSNKYYILNTFCGGNQNYRLIYKNRKYAYSQH